MKKFLAMIMALALVFSMSTVAFAGSPIDMKDGNDNDSRPVTVDVKENKTGTIYHVAVAWDSLEFTYNLNADAGTWQPSDHTYSEPGTGAGWVAGANDIVEGNKITRSNAITVTNHSNASVDVTASQDPADGVNCEVTIDTVKKNLPSADHDDYRESKDGIYDHSALKAVYSVAVTKTGELVASDDITIANIIVTVSPA